MSKAKKRELPPAVSEWMAACKATGGIDEDTQNAIATQLGRSDTTVRLLNVSLAQPLTKALTRFFQKYTKIQSVTFHGCVLVDEGFIRQFAVDFPKNSATSLSLDFMNVSRDVVAQFLALPTLDCLSVRGNGTFALAGAFPFTFNAFLNTLMCGTLKVLNLYGCGLGDAGAVAMASCLYFNTSLVGLGLGKNRIGDTGALALADALSQHVLTSRELDIRDQLQKEEARSRVSDEGGQLNLKKKKGAKVQPAKKPAPKPAAKKGKEKPALAKLTNFDPASPVTPQLLARWNSVVTTDAGLKAIAGNATLSTLLLDENQIGEVGAEALYRMLEFNKKMVGFSIEANPDLPEGMAARLARRPTVLGV